MEIENLLYDHKESIYCKTPIDLMMTFFSDTNSLVDDLELPENNTSAYKELGWDSEQYFDVISSFWTTFSFAMHCHFPEDYGIAEAGNVKIYKNTQEKYKDIFKSFPEKYLGINSKERDQVVDLCRSYTGIQELAKLCHSMANFMPCPEGFNGVKGSLKDVKDYFPLMIDKIQECIDEKAGLTEQIDLNTVCSWHTFFLNNQKRFCLDMFYSIENTKLKGIPFFHNQTLRHPCPMNSDEVTACLANMIGCIKRRATKIFALQQKNTATQI